MSTSTIGPRTTAATGAADLDEPPTPVSANWIDDRAPLRTASPETLAPSPSPPPPQPPSSSSKWKGKAKAVDSGSGSLSPAERLATPTSAEVDLGRTSSSSPRTADAARESLVPSTYPPATDEAVEEQKVNATLKRWEELERLRRRAARESRNVSIDSTASRRSATSSSGSGGGDGVGAQRADVTRRGSLFWSGGKSRKPAPGSHPLSSGDIDEEDRSPSAEDFSLPPDSEDVGVVPVNNAGGSSSSQPDDLQKGNGATAREAFIARHKTSRSQDSHVSDSSAVTVTLENASRHPSAPSPDPGPSDPHYQPGDRSSVISTSSANPFVDPTHSRSSTVSSSKALNNKGKQTPRTMSQSSDPFADGEDGDELPSIPHAPTAGAQGMARPARYPTPKPLGLTSDALFDDGRSKRKGRRGPQRRQSVEGDDDDYDGPAEEGRWWTDWLCGCREGPDRGGDHQAAKTNPME